MNDYSHRTLIVPDKLVVFARGLTLSIAGQSAENMWSTALSKTGDLPVTHWISSGLISNDFVGVIPFMEYQNDGTEVKTKGQPDVCQYLASQAGFKTSKEEIETLFEQADITEQDAFTTLGRLGLKLITEDETQKSIAIKAIAKVSSSKSNKSKDFD